MPKLATVHCRICHQDIDRNTQVENVDWVMPSKNWFYHKTCYEQWAKSRKSLNVKSNLDEQTWFDFLYEYLHRDVLMEINFNKLRSQWRKFVADGFKPKGIFFTVKYYYDIQKGKKESADGGIGIVPYIYKEATEYWVEQENFNRGLVEKIEDQMLSRIERTEIVKIGKVETKEMIRRKKIKYKLEDW